MLMRKEAFGQRQNIVRLIAILSIIILIILGFYVRYYPFKNYQYIEKVAIKYGLKKTAKYSYLDANDPWIEYWLARYLHFHGIGSWKSLNRSNPVTKIFWYPWGRDFVHTEFPFISVVGALTPDRIRVVEWVSLLPPIFGALMIVAGVIYVWRFYGLYAALAASALLSLLPASTSRTYAGFVEKIGIAMPFFIFFIMFYSEALRSVQTRKTYIYSTVAGLFLGSISYVWGGYALASLALAVTALFLPLAYRRLEDALTAEISTTIAGLVGFLISIPADLYGPISAKIVIIPALLAAVLAVTLYGVRRIATSVKRVERQYILERFRRYYLWASIALIIIGPIAAPALGIIRGRALFALAWPLRELGIVHISRLAETVAEHSSPFSTPQLFRSFLWETNIMLFMAPIAAVYLLYRIFKKYEPEHLLLALLVLGLYYAVLGMVYFEQAAAVISALAISSLVGFVKTGEPVKGKRGRRRGGSTEYAELILLTAIVLAIIIASGVIAGAYQTTRFVKNHIAVITGYSKYNVELGWLYLLQYLREKVPNNTVVVAWWDYGYQISVGGDKPSLADGATINATQIRILADFFTATSEDEASSILKNYFHLKPNNTLIFVHDIVLYNPEKGIVIYTPSIDIPKSAAMLHISGKDEKGFMLINDLYKQTMIFKLFSSAPYYLTEYGIGFPNFTKIGQVNRAYIYWFPQLIPLKKYEFKHFKPYMVILGYIFNPKTGLPVRVHIGTSGFEGYYYEAVMLIVYKWIG
jgi:dolichyl-diphosphooligosaccharide--protein glycosyltransferase